MQIKSILSDTPINYKYFIFGRIFGTLLAFFTFVIVTVVSKYVSLGSLCMAAGFFVEFVIFAVLKMLPLSGNSIVEGIVLAFIISALAFIKHHANIQRLLNGTERKIGGEIRVMVTLK